MWANCLERCSAWCIFHLIVVVQNCACHNEWHALLTVVVHANYWTEHSKMVHENMFKHERAFMQENNDVKPVQYQNARAIENGWVSSSSRIAWEQFIVSTVYPSFLPFFTIYQWCLTFPEFRSATWSVELRSNCPGGFQIPNHVAMECVCVTCIFVGMMVFIPLKLIP